MDIVNQILDYLRDGFAEVNALQGLIIAFIAALLLPEIKRLPVFVLGAAVIHIAVDELAPVFANGARRRLRVVSAGDRAVTTPSVVKTHQSALYTTGTALAFVGRSVEGRPIEVYRRRADGEHLTLALGGFHGDEPKSVYVACRLIDTLASFGSESRIGSWLVVPLVNPDGFARRKRRNANKVDINRNFPTVNWSPGNRRSRMHGGPAAASEPETRCVIDLIEAERPTRIVTLHSIGGHRYCNNYDGPAAGWARRMTRLNGYPARASIGYPTPGSFGTWAGIERRIPTITLELPSHHSSKRCWADNREALLDPVPSSE